MTQAYMLSIIKIVKQNSLIIEKLMIVQTDTFRGSRPRPFDDTSEPAKEEKRHSAQKGCLPGKCAGRTT